jgi:hypothetical protein
MMTVMVSLSMKVAMPWCTLMVKTRIILLGRDFDILWSVKKLASDRIKMRANLQTQRYLVPYKSTVFSMLFVSVPL